jgi:hypothetical protein
MIGGLLRSGAEWQVIHYTAAVVRKCSLAFASVRICFVPFAPLVPQAGEMNNVNRRCMPRSQIVRCVLETRLSGPVAWNGMGRGLGGWLDWSGLSPGGKARLP